MKISDARKILDKTLLDMKALDFPDSIDTDADLYWMIPQNQTFDMNNDPTDYEVGNIREEYESVMSRIDSGDIVFPDSLLLLSSLFRLAYDMSGIQN